ncbi:conserved hypothetical protein [Frankia canadensis]|uniref:RNHCP domain-containing protein n=1 Tax=Frankia canadensis TaxID=1836972 RepID=A0A2I2L2I4_9ACTN|nr:RNHCP domain-containing protein [Frankia canadensis]SNQ52077.1 conserved hypothetical protein [Frankia canadensis]SOU59367.1 conserved hypothetical protein [Frankia canadensis]
MSRRFTRVTEDFDCLVCGAAVRGDGYTNHCPSCLCSRHVDVHPGDRGAGCGGVMRPVGVEFGPRETVLTHACERCGERRRCRTSPADDRDALFAVASAAATATTGIFAHPRTPVAPPRRRRRAPGH